MAESGAYSGFGIVNLMGHLRRAGKISEVESFGTKLLRVDIPVVGEGDHEEWVTEFYGGGAIYSLCPATEAIAREAARRIGDPRPVNPVGFLPPARGIFGESERDRERELFDETMEDDDE